MEEGEVLPGALRHAALNHNEEANDNSNHTPQKNQITQTHQNHKEGHKATAVCPALG